MTARAGEDEVDSSEEALSREGASHAFLLLLSDEVGGWDWDAATGTTHWSDTMWRLYGFDEPQASAAGIWEASLHPDDRSRARELVATRLASNETKFRDEFRIVHPDGSVRWIEAIAKVTRDGAGKAVRMSGVNLDITARKEAEERLRDSEERQTLLLSVSDAVRPLTDPEEIRSIAMRLLRSHLLVSQAVYMDGEGDPDTSADSVEPWPASVSLADLGAAFGEDFVNGRSVAIENMQADLQHLNSRDRTGALRSGAAVGVPVTKGGRVVAAVAVLSETPRSWSAGEIVLIEDVAERTWAAMQRARVETAVRHGEEQAQDRRVDVARRQQWLAGEQAERSRWARELHDETLQGMAAIQVQLVAAMQSPENRDEHLRVASDLAREEIGKLRALISELRPSALAEFGLAPTLATLADEAHERGGPEVVLHLGDGARERLPAEVELAVYRIVQEAVRNASQHAGADRVNITIRRFDGSYEAVITDDGSGFDQARAAAGYGLDSMRERAELAGGTLEVSSIPKEGTRVRLVVPIS